MTSRRPLDVSDLDPFTRAVLAHPDPNVLASPTDTRLRAIRDAGDAALGLDLKSNRPLSDFLHSSCTLSGLAG